MWRYGCTALMCLLLLACRQPDAPAQDAVTGEAAPENTITTTAGGDFISAPPAAAPVQYDLSASSDWPPARLSSGTARISCETDYARGDGEPLVNLEYFSVLDAMSPCRDSGVLRVRYQGRIASDFTELMTRVSEMAKRMEIKTRILDIDSAGGQVENAIEAGDAIGASGWTIWVREGSVCHSACVLILASGDTRMISGKVGVHRIIRLRSKATSRAELSRELADVQSRIEDYLERNGASIAVANLMMTVPNRSLRVLGTEELDSYGLNGANAIQDDLERIRLARECGEDFVYRKDAFARAFGYECATEGVSVARMNACGLTLRKRFGFPDRKCPAASPFADMQ